MSSDVEKLNNKVKWIRTGFLHGKEFDSKNPIAKYPQIKFTFTNKSRESDVLPKEGVEAGEKPKNLTHSGGKVQRSSQRS